MTMTLRDRAYELTLVPLLPSPNDLQASDDRQDRHSTLEPDHSPQAETLYRAIFETSEIGIALVDLHGRPITANAAVQRFLGYSEAELQAKDFTEFTLAEDVATDWALFQELLADVRPSYTLEKRFVRSDGRIVWGSLTASLVRDAAGAVQYCLSMVEDIGARKDAEAAQRFQADLLAAVQQAVIATDPEGRITYFNRTAEHMYGWIAAEAVGQNIVDIRPADPTREQASEIVHRLKVGETWSGEFIVRRRDGTRFPALVTDAPILGVGGHITGIIDISIDITDRKQAEDALKHQALHDSLTGLPNRVLLRDRLEQALLTCRRDDTSLSLAIVDLDRFKEVNDTLGHPIGDALLQVVAERFRSALRTTDTVARLGGDEFAILLPGTGGHAAGLVIRGLLAGLQLPVELNGQTIGVSASVGVAVFPEHGGDTDMLLRRADVAMYQAKTSGTGVAIYNHADDPNRPERLVLLTELRHAIDRDELLLHYQPKLDLRDGTLVGVEALVRWQHPQRGFLPPSDFIPLAEQSGLIQPLTEWVLDAALRQQRAWRTTGRRIPIAVNLSRRTLHDPQLPGTVASLLARWDVPADALVLEITESSLMADPVHAGENLTQLRALGVHLSIDDFGTGYSSLASLKDLAVDELKIDQSFVQTMATDANSRAIVRAIIDLADALELRVVAEGVEDRAAWDVLAGLGCDAAQGYFLSRPVAAPELETWLAQTGPTWLEIATQSMAADPLRERIRERGARLTAEEEFLARKRAEVALHASEQRNRLALEAAGMGSWDSDVLHNVLSWSTETEALHGVAPGTFEGTFEAFMRTVHPDDRAAFEYETTSSLLERRESAITFRAVWPDGSVHWLESKARTQYAVDGTRLRVNGVTVDISERKRAEEAVLASEERFRSQYKNLPVPTYSWLYDGDDFTLEDYNDAAQAKATIDLQDLRGARASARYADQPALRNDLRTCLTEQRTVKRQMRYRFPESGCERDMAFTYVFVPPLTVMVHAEDVTADTQAEQEREVIAQDRAILAAIITSSTAAIFSRDLNDIITSWNAGAQRLYGYTPEEILGVSATCLVPPDRSDEARSLRDRIMSEGNVEHFETERLRKTGARVEVAVSMSPIRDSAGSIVGAATIARDIGERKQMERDLQETRDLAVAASQAKSEFLSSLGCAILEPTNSVIETNRLLLRTALNPRQRRYAEAARRSGEVLMTLVNGLPGATHDQ